MTVEESTEQQHPFHHPFDQQHQYHLNHPSTISHAATTSSSFSAVQTARAMMLEAASALHTQHDPHQRDDQPTPKKRGRPPGEAARIWRDEQVIQLVQLIGSPPYRRLLSRRGSTHAQRLADWNALTVDLCANVGLDIAESQIRSKVAILKKKWEIARGSVSGMTEEELTALAAAGKAGGLSEAVMQAMATSWLSEDHPQQDSGSPSESSTPVPRTSVARRSSWSKRITPNVHEDADDDSGDSEQEEEEEVDVDVEAEVGGKRAKEKSSDRNGESEGDEEIVDDEGEEDEEDDDEDEDELDPPYKAERKRRKSTATLMHRQRKLVSRGVSTALPFVSELDSLRALIMTMEARATEADARHQADLQAIRESQAVCMSSLGSILQTLENHGLRLDQVTGLLQPMLGGMMDDTTTTVTTTTTTASEDLCHHHHPEDQSSVQPEQQHAHHQGSVDVASLLLTEDMVVVDHSMMSGESL